MSQYQERERGTVALPSKGRYYNDGIIPHENGVIEVYLLGPREEKILASKVRSDFEGAMDAIIESVVVRDPGERLRPERMLVGDRLALLFLLRSASFGSEYGFNFQCPACRHKDRYTVSAPDDFLLNHPPDWVKEPFSITLPRNNAEVVFRMLRGEDERRVRSYVEKISKKRMKGIPLRLEEENDPALTFRQALRIISINGEDLSDMGSIPKKMSFLENRATGMDGAVLQQCFEDFDCGYDMTTDITCNSCGHVEMEVAIPPSKEFFRPRIQLSYRSGGEADTDGAGETDREDNGGYAGDGIPATE